MNTDTPDSIWAGVTSCPLHTSDVPGNASMDADEDCKGCQDEMTGRNAAIESLQDEAQMRMDELMAAQVQFPPQAIDHIRLELLIEQVFHGRNAFLFEGEAGRRVVETMKAIQSQQTKQSIAPDKRLTVVRNGMRPKQ